MLDGKTLDQLDDVTPLPRCELDEGSDETQAQDCLN
jgi:hypothetical protein